MAKLTSLFKFNGTFEGVTVVNSRAYGKHLRKARTSYSLSAGMKVSADVMKQANVYAKLFKDAIDPYRRECRDGMLWQRLVSLFKRQIQEDGSGDFSVLEGQELNKVHPFSRIFGAQTTVTQSAMTLGIQVRSYHLQDPSQGRADGYEQTLIILFALDKKPMQTFSESVHIALQPGTGEQQMTCAIPDSATTAIVVIKCNFSSNKEPMNLQRGMGMRVEKVVALKFS